MYGKAFDSMYTGSMMGSGADVFAIWGYVISKTVDSQVELNPRLLAVLIGMTEERATAAIEYLCAPDPASRTKAEEGRRLIREGEYAYHVVNHEEYNKIRDEGERRQYMREYMRERRAKDKDGAVNPVNNSKHALTELAPVSPYTVSVSVSEVVGKGKSARKGKSESKPRATWLTPIAAAHEEIFGVGSFASLAGRFAKSWKPLVDAHGAEKCGRVWAFANRPSDPERKFRTPENVASKFADFDPDALVSDAERFGGEGYRVVGT